MFELSLTGIAGLVCAAVVKQSAPKSKLENNLIAVIIECVLAQYPLPGF